MTGRGVITALWSPWRWYQEKIRLILELSNERDRLRRELSDERDRLRRVLDESAALQSVAPGHFYSPIPSKNDVNEHLVKQARQTPLRELPAIMMNDRLQMELMESLKHYYSRVPFRAEPVEGLLYHLDNPNYPHSDGIILFCMLNHLRPRRLIEIGSGYSTCAILDTNRLFLDSQMQITCIEPHTELLRSLLVNSNDVLTIVESKLQDVQIDIFDQLDGGDILFIDSSHVSKVGSDVNYIIFEILPRLKTGVVIHIHDIYFNFEYPGVWLREGRAWNEAYLLRAFLEYNEHFRILHFSSYVQNWHEDWFRKHMPETLVNKGGCFWMEKI
ncbi:MAG TPA: class I SAM-dependent methyltransferase [Bryobacteraceae bacterium]|nr:class I SAM-dependent methyltransferase [Bryobacteraceae bacterium]